MGHHHAEETHQTLLQRTPSATGKDLSDWYALLDQGPSFSRTDDRVHWLQDEHGIAHGYAKAIVQEYSRWKASARA